MAVSASPIAGIPRWLLIWSWALYDLANTIFSAILVTRYFPLAMTERMEGQKLPIAIASVASLAAAGIVSPVAGALMDRIGRGRLLLSAATMVCILFTALIGMLIEGPGRNHLLLGLYGVANFFYNLALVFYNAYLPHLAPPEEQGRVSGLGVGVGYVGILPAIFLAAMIQRRFGDAGIYYMAAVLFFLLALPCLVLMPSLVPDRSVRLGEAFRGFWRDAADIWRDRGSRNFFIGNFLCTDVLNALIQWVIVYIAVVFPVYFGIDENKDFYWLLLVSSNIVCSLIAGWLSDRFSAKSSYLLCAACLFLALVGAGLSYDPVVLIWLTVPLAGFGLGGIWTSGRKLLFGLCPPGALGRYSGFYGFTGKVSSFTTVIFAAITHGQAGAGLHRLGIIALAAPVVVGFLFILAVREHRAEKPDPSIRG